MVQRLRSTLLLAVLLVAGCAVNDPSVAGTAPRDANLISAAEIQAAGVSNALEAVERLRPQWMRSRGSDQPVLVYEGSTRIGDLSSLRQFPASEIENIRFLNRSAANALPGVPMGGIAAAIVIRRHGNR